MTVTDDIVTGVIDGVLSVYNGLETWITRFNAIQNDSISLSFQQRTLLFEQMECWVSALNESVAKLSSFLQPDSANESHTDDECVMYVSMIASYHILCTSFLSAAKPMLSSLNVKKLICLVRQYLAVLDYLKLDRLLKYIFNTVHEA